MVFILYSKKIKNMNKELLITLINKDIDELKSLTKGFVEMNCIPDAIIDLSVAKAQSIVDCLQKLPLCVEKVEANTVQPVIEKIAVEEIIPQPVVEEKTEEKKPEIIEEKPAEIQIEPIIEEKKEPVVETIIVEVEEKAEEVEEKREKEVKKSEPILDVLSSQPKHESLIDSLVKDEKTVANNIQKNKIDDLKQAFSIADRFRFQRELFDNNGEKFALALSTFNAMTTMNEAHNYISKHFNWNFENGVVVEFIDILERKLV
jgi:hypothetical protein